MGDGTEVRSIERNVRDKRNRSVLANQFARAGRVHGSVSGGIQHDGVERLDADQSFECIPRICDAELVMNLHCRRDLRGLLRRQEDGYAHTCIRYGTLITSGSTVSSSQAS